MDTFGLLKGHNLTNMEPTERQQILLPHGLMEPIHVITLSSELKRVFPPTNPPVMKYTQQVVNDLHSFLLDHYVNLIDGSFYGFFHDFNEESFGLGKKTARKLALQYYSQLSDSMITKSIRFIRVKTDKSGIESVKNLGKLEMLDGQRNALKSNLALSALMDYYLMGDKSYFSVDLIEEDKMLRHFVDFESSLKILLSLNQTYGFEHYPSFVAKEKNIEKPVGPKWGNPKIRRSPVLSDKDALDYLLKNVFGSKGNHIDPKGFS